MVTSARRRLWPDQSEAGVMSPPRRAGTRSWRHERASRRLSRAELWPADRRAQGAGANRLPASCKQLSRAVVALPARSKL